MISALQATPEQQEAVERFQRGENLKLVAAAGSGKTTTLRLMAQANPRKRIMYLAFNRSVKEEGKRKMPLNVQVYTLHGLAYREMVRSDPNLLQKLRLGGGQVRASHVWEALDGQLRDLVSAYVVKATLDAFLRSNLSHPTVAMVPLRYRDLARRRRREDEVGAILEAVKELWARMQNPADPFPLSHDGYVKLWAQSGPRIGGVEALLVDEAQDLDPVFAQVLEGQRGLQRVYVGDPNQEIYGWRGAVNALEGLDAHEAYLTWSFRFGEGLASKVRGLMAHLGRELRLVGKAAWETEVVEDPRDLEPPYTVLCRTNIGVVDALVRLVPKRAYVYGGVNELIRLLEDAEALRRGEPRPNPHPDLVLLESWDDLMALAEEVGDPTASVLASLASVYNDLASLASYLASVAVSREADAEIVFSTAHKAKGMEWPQVLLWEDFPRVWDPKVRRAILEHYGPSEGRAFLWQEENLLYVAATRAMRLLATHLPIPWGGEASSQKERGALEFSPIEVLTPRTPKEDLLPLEGPGDPLEAAKRALARALGRGDLPPDLEEELRRLWGFLDRLARP